jgi:hypothetical protein
MINEMIRFFKFDITEKHINGAIAYIAIEIEYNGECKNVPLLAVQEYNKNVSFNLTCGRSHAVYTTENTWFLTNYIENGLDPREVFSINELKALTGIIKDCVDMKSNNWPKLATEIISEHLGAPVYF